VNAAEADFIEMERKIASHKAGAEGVWRALVFSPNVWFLCLAYFSNSYGSYFTITWLPTYLAEQRGFQKETLILFSGLPLILSVAGDLSGGAITDFLTRRFGLRFGRCAVSVVGYGLAGTAMFASVFSTAVVSALLIAVAIASSMFALSASWATCMDVGGEHTALLSAAMNTTGQVGSILSPLVAGWIVTAFRIGRRHCSSWAAFIPFRPCCGSWWTHVSGYTLTNKRIGRQDIGSLFHHAQPSFISLRMG
jgi:ACS family glucarate transporter-like MFS transporter